ncbi:unnamed protein product [Arctia plantaginis]|uniref:Uncharacterized protein n=1 Tax=Arctia plantaginis TaxID=874455 RepID=A0A8S1B6X7_ARCPL|nr:unnamed protein product [Arctia plantaginis]
MAGTAYAAESVDAADTEQNTLDVEVLEILGVDPTTAKKYHNEIKKDLAVRLEHSAIEGLSKDTRKELVDTYFVPSNFKLIGAPVMNLELKAPYLNLT